ncbi:hypothetical protein JXA48_03390 [Candidatus Woesearchaeota archaeon]|nr:hypothetical protein [Candidatus Woesearchaeota archaeon]
MIDFSFKDIQSIKQLDELATFLHFLNLGYKNYDDWVEKARFELSIEYKKAITIHSEGKLVGDVIWQPHKSLPRTKEIKNIRVNPLAQGHGCAYFATKQAELEDKEDYDLIVVDAPANKIDVYSFLIQLGYKPIMTTPLYDGQTPDVFFVKSLKDNSKLTEVKEYITQKSHGLKDF